MTRIYAVAYHQSKFGKLYDKTLEQMLHEAASGVLDRAGAEADVVDAVGLAGCCAPALNQQLLLSGLLADAPGFAGKQIHTAENACASGGQAILDVVMRLKAGLADVGLAIGVEKMRNDQGKMDGKVIGQVLGTASHPDQRPGKVFVFPHLFAEIMKLYIDTHGSSEEELAHVPVLEYANANRNPLAQMHKVEVGLDDVMRIEGVNRYIVDGLPLKTYDSSQITDGYAALLLCNEDGLRKLSVAPDQVVEIAGYSQRTDPLNTSIRDDILRPRGAYAAVASAYKMAGIDMTNVSLAEVHDCFSVMGAMSAEIIGKAEYGQGGRYFAEGEAAVDGACPINTSGGLIAKGHPIGATGVAMVGWAYSQILGEVPEALQVADIDHAVTFNIGGPICASAVFVLRGNN
ncbi:thiolase family protein [Haliangium sp.]|uniref:thiolase family protein n=1 Tax=Haliangium sp. TaxID=2663208 RepID=UPI003D149CE8